MSMDEQQMPQLKPAEPIPARSKIWKKIRIISTVFMLLGAGFIIYFIFNPPSVVDRAYIENIIIGFLEKRVQVASGAPIDAAKQFFQNISSGKIDKAYAEFAEDLKENVTLQDAEALILRFPTLAGANDVSLSLSSLQDSDAGVRGTISAGGVEKIFVTIALRKEGGTWQVRSFNFAPILQEIPTSSSTLQAIAAVAESFFDYLSSGTSEQAYDLQSSNAKKYISPEDFRSVIFGKFREIFDAKTLKIERVRVGSLEGFYSQVGEVGVMAKDFNGKTYEFLVLFVEDGNMWRVERIEL